MDAKWCVILGETGVTLSASAGRMQLSGSDVIGQRRTGPAAVGMKDAELGVGLRVSDRAMFR